MKGTRRSVLAGLALSTLLTTRGEAQTAPPSAGGPTSPGLPQPFETIDLWPGAAPGSPARLPQEKTTERSKDTLITDRAVLGISVPRLAVFRPDRPNGAALLLTPGGGYKHVVVDKEGYEIARWATARGFTCFVLFYRLPYDGWADRADVPLQDAQRAMRVIRSRYRDYAIDPERVGIMGFSAGGHLCADLGTRFDAKVYEPVDDTDNLSAKPFFAAPIYPVVSMTPGIAHAGSRELLLGANPSKAMEAAHSPDRNVPDDAPPFFIVAAEDDPAVPVENSVMLRAALKAKKIPVETHLFMNGGHGFGLRLAVGKPVAAWPDLWRAWAQTIGFA